MFRQRFSSPFKRANSVSRRRLSLYLHRLLNRVIRTTRPIPYNESRENFDNLGRGEGQDGFRIKFIVNRPETMEFLLDFSVLVGILGILDYNSRRIARRFVRRGAETRPSFPKERKFDIGLEWIVYIYIYMYDYRGGEKRGGGNQETIFRSNFHGMGLSIVVSSGRSFSRFIFPPRETRIVALFQWE